MGAMALLLEGVRLMVIGMGIVFTFLLLLVGVMRVMSAAAMRFAPESRLPAADSRLDTEPAADTQMVAVITAAVARYRRSRQQLRR